jgi:hypothetical protein
LAGWQWQEIVGGGSAVILSGGKSIIHFLWQWLGGSVAKRVAGWQFLYYFLAFWAFGSFLTHFNSL